MDQPSDRSFLRRARADLDSLEARSPFLDHKFLEFSAKIPAHNCRSGMNCQSATSDKSSAIIPVTARIISDLSKITAPCQISSGRYR